MELQNETSTTVPSTDYIVDKLPHSVHVFGFGLYVTLLVLAVVVDTTILFVFYRAKELRNVTNSLLCNMVAADLLFALQTPMEGIAILNDNWTAGNEFCKIHRFLLHTFYGVVIISLTIVSIERYYAICLPLKFKSLEIKSWIPILASWIAAGILALPQIFLSSTATSYDRQICIQERPDDYLIVFLCYHVPLFIFLYVIPLGILTFTYAKVSRKLYDVIQRYRSRSRFDICDAMRMRRNIIRMLLAVVIVFVVCLTPLTVLELLHVTPVMNKYDPFGILIVSVEMLVVSHALLNPLVSSFMSKEFRKAAIRAFLCPRSQKKRYCIFKCKEKENNCKLQQVKQNDAIGPGNGKKLWLNNQSLNESGDVLKKEGIINKAFVLTLHTLERAESSVTEMTEIPKEDE